MKTHKRGSSSVFNSMPKPIMKNEKRKRRTYCVWHDISNRANRLDHNVTSRLAHTSAIRPQLAWGCRFFDYLIRSPDLWAHTCLSRAQIFQRPDSTLLTLRHLHHGINRELAILTTRCLGTVLFRAPCMLIRTRRRRTQAWFICQKENQGEVQEAGRVYVS